MSAYAETILEAAWSRLAPGRLPLPFPRGFWPDVARLAVEMALADDLSHEPDWRPTICGHGSWPEPEPRSPPSRKPRAAGKISAADKAANTAALLAALKGAK